MRLPHRITSILVMLLPLSLASGCVSASRKTAPLAPSGVLAACSGSELVVALGIDRSKAKLTHGLTVGTERGGEVGATAGVEGGGGKVEVEGKVARSSSEEKASEIGLELPSPALCVERGYWPQMGRWTVSAADANIDIGRGKTLGELSGKMCVQSDLNHCFCARPPGMPKSCGQKKKDKQVAALKASHEAFQDPPALGG